MRFIDIFITKPVLSISLSLMILIVGLGCYFTLQVREFPYVNSANITITTDYYGADPSTMQAFITRKLEASVSKSDGIDYMTSSSTLGVSTITIYVKFGFDPDTTLSQVVQYVNAVSNQLPADAQSPSIQLNPADNFPALVLAFTSDTLSPSAISAYVDNVFTPKIMANGGVSDVNSWGDKPYAMRVFPNTKLMAKYGVTTSDIATSIEANSLITAGGDLKGPYLNYVLSPKTSLTQAKDYKNLVVKKSGNQLIRLGDVAKVDLGSQTYDYSVKINGKDAVQAGIVVASNANQLDVVSDILKQLPEFERTMPKGLKVSVAYNSSTYIQDSIDDVIKTLIEAVIIVSIILFLFLGSLRAIIVPLIAIPLSIIGSFFLMTLMGFSINLLTLLAIILAIGLVVDDAIVVLENIYRNIEEYKLSPFAAAVKGAREIANPVILMTLTLVIVYIPIGFMSGYTGKLFTEFAYSLASSVIISGIVAYTLSPMLCSKILTKESMNTKFARFLEKLFSHITSKYKASLEFVLETKKAIIVCAVIVLLSCFYMFLNIKSELDPTEDQGFISVMGQAPSTAGLNYLDKFSSALYKVMDKEPNKKNIFALDGVMSDTTVFQGFIMTDWSERKTTQAEEAAKIQSDISMIPGLSWYVIQPPSLPGIPRGPSMQFVIQTSDSYPALNSVANKIVEKMKSSGLFVFANSDLIFDDANININIDRNKTGIMGITMNDIAKTLGYSYSEGYLNYFYLDGYSFEVIPRLVRNQIQTTEQLGNIYIKTDSNSNNVLRNQVPLSSIVNFKTFGRPSSLNTFQQLNSATISAVTARGVTTSDALAYMDKLAKTMLPKGYSYDYSGQARTYLQNSSTMMVAFAFAIIMIFLALSAQFGSFIDSLIILVTVPMAISGALLPLYIYQNFNSSWASLNIYTELGLITLIGLISKQGILVVEFANELQIKHGMSKYDAIVKSASQRLRPILMTVMAMAVGVIPLVISSGAGAVSRNCIGIVIFSGLIIGAIFSLFILPVIYIILSTDKAAFVKKQKEQREIIDNLKE
ncbi:efflux RND transporter permease subunit [Francisella uliginis]|uniref:Multidrug efflux protein n=1 Tax=Francisella uliginis TaxID=573570 RepID=A0A1L4BQ79_9GAMM|nr:efflux RND transporter permease subunit [Francisella uliginis]API86005.1 multidrug efflux protein [Francisella uliginis]